jgi:hypothetical protein
VPKEKKELLELREVLDLQDKVILENLAVAEAAAEAAVVFTKKVDPMVVTLVHLEVALLVVEAAVDKVVHEEMIDM